MIGTLSVGENRNGTPFAFASPPETIRVLRGESGQAFDPMNYSRLLGYPVGIPVMMAPSANRFYTYGRTLRSLPSVGALGGESNPYVIEAENQVNAYAEAAAQMEARLGDWRREVAQEKLATAQAALSRLSAMPSTGGWLQDAAKSITTTAQSAVKEINKVMPAAVQTAAQQVAHAAIVNAQNAAHAAVAAGNSVTVAANKAVTAAKQTYNSVVDKVKSTISSMTGTPGRKLAAGIALLPPPANLAWAAKFCKDHKDEILKELPPYARDFIVKVQNGAARLFGGQTETISGIGGIGNVGSTFAEVKAKIAQAWDHQSAGTKAAIIAVLIIALIIGIILTIYGGPAGLWAAIQTWWAGTTITAAGFMAAIGGMGAASALVKGLWDSLLGHFQKSGAPASVTTAAASQPPGDPPADPALVQATAEENKSGIPDFLKVAGPVAAGALLFL